MTLELKVPLELFCFKYKRLPEHNQFSPCVRSAFTCWLPSSKQTSKYSTCVRVKWTTSSSSNQTLVSSQPFPYGQVIFPQLQESAVRHSAVERISSFSHSPHLALRRSLSSHYCHMAGFHQALCMEASPIIQHWDNRNTHTQQSSDKTIFNPDHLLSSFLLAQTPHFCSNVFLAKFGRPSPWPGVRVNSPTARIVETPKNKT